MIQVKWVHSYQIGIAKSSDEDVAMVELITLRKYLQGQVAACRFGCADEIDSSNSCHSCKGKKDLLSQLEVRS